jgi:hypothetical protein
MQSNLALSFAVSILSAIIINFVWAFNMNIIDDRVMTFYNEALGTHSQKRYEQRIEINFSYDNNSGTLKASITHTFDYKKSEIGKTCEMRIFSDFRGEIPKEDRLKDPQFTPDFYFKQAGTDAKHLKWANLEDRAKLCNVENGKLLYTDDSTVLNENTDTHFRFEIRNKYKPHDRMVWNFQDHSDCVTIVVNRDNSCKDKLFYFRLNHPNAKLIMESFQKSQSGSVRENDGLITGNLNFEINRAVLPYHGFEILWDIK